MDNPDDPLGNVYRFEHRQPPGKLDLIDPTTLDGLPVPPREWHVEPLIPRRTVTLLSGDGGVGKSLFSLQLATSTALGSSWINRTVAPGRALFLTAEDETAEVHRRLFDICAAEGARLADLGNLRVTSLADKEETVLAAPTKAGQIKGTPLWAGLEAACEEFSPRLLVLDNAADLFAGEESSRVHVPRFIGMLRGLAVRRDLTIMLLQHPSLSGLNSGSGTSGSTAWSNSVRSRLYLTPAEKDGKEPDPNLRILKTMKANYGMTGGEMALRWQMGRFVAEEGTVASAFDRVAAKAQAEEVFLDLVRAYDNEGRAVSPNTSSTYAPAVFARDQRSKGIRSRALEAAMNSLFEARRIKVVTTGPKSRLRPRIVPRDPHETDSGNTGDDQ